MVQEAGEGLQGWGGSPSESGDACHWGRSAGRHRGARGRPGAGVDEREPAGRRRGETERALRGEVEERDPGGWRVSRGEEPRRGALDGGRLAAGPRGRGTARGNADRGHKVNPRYPSRGNHEDQCNLGPENKHHTPSRPTLLATVGYYLDSVPVVGKIDPVQNHTKKFTPCFQRVQTALFLGIKNQTPLAECSGARRMLKLQNARNRKKLKEENAPQL